MEKKNRFFKQNAFFKKKHRFYRRFTKENVAFLFVFCYNMLDVWRVCVYVTGQAA